MRTASSARKDDTQKKEWWISSKRQMHLICDAMNGLQYHLPTSKDLMFMAFLDYVSLLHQQRVVYALWRKLPGKSKNHECCKVFLEDPSYLERFRACNGFSPNKQMNLYLGKRATKWEWISLSKVPIKQTSGIIELPTPKEKLDRFGISIHKINTIKEFLDQKDVLNIDEEVTEKVCRLLHQKSSIQILSEPFCMALYEAASSYQNREEHEKSETHCDRVDLSIDELNYFLKPIEEVLNDITKDIGSFPDLTIKKNCLPNLFAVVKVFLGEKLRYKNQFDYSCRFMLLKKVRQWLEDKNNYEDSDKRKLLSILEEPLPYSLRSLSDFVFSNGTVTFRLDLNVEQDSNEKDDFSGLRSDSESDDKTKDWLKFVAPFERKIYPDKPYIFYSPVHVNSVPWVAIYTLSDEDESVWYYNYLFYRHVGQRVASQIRSKASSIYVDLFVRSVINALESKVYTDISDIAFRINERLRKLAQVYPFPLGQFAEEGEKFQCLDMKHYGQLYLVLTDNPFFCTKENDLNATLNNLLSTCQEQVAGFVDHNKLLVARSVGDHVHLIKGHLGKLERLAKGNEPISALVERILVLSRVAEGYLSKDKLESFKKDYGKIDSCGKFEKLVQEEYHVVLDLLRNSAYSKRGLVNEIQKIDTFLKEVSVTSELDAGQCVAHYKPLVSAVLEGLVKNAITNIWPDKPTLSITLKSNSNFVFLTVVNSVDPAKNVKKLVFELNNPGPKISGVNQLHWIASSFWGISPEWTELSTTHCICANVPLGELK